MKIAAVSTMFQKYTLQECLDIFADAGVNGVEISVGGFHGTPHIDVDALLNNETERTKYLMEFSKRGLELVALACHGNPLHPDENISNIHKRDFERAVGLAAQLGVETIVCISGCPGTDPDARHPAWLSSAWPLEAREITKRQWEEVALPYWAKAADFAKKHGVRVAIEMHPSNLVYNPATLKKLRDATNDHIGANIDPSHLFWQGIDPAAAAKELGDAVYHVHAKDTAIDTEAMTVNGCLDAATIFDEIPRTWRFAVPGEGHSEEVWTRFINALKDTGYKGTLSIEHEARAVEPEEGLRRASKFLQKIIK